MKTLNGSSTDFSCKNNKLLIGVFMEVTGTIVREKNSFEYRDKFILKLIFFSLDHQKFEAKLQIKNFNLNLSLQERGSRLGSSWNEPSSNKRRSTNLNNEVDKSQQNFLEF